MIIFATEDGCFADRMIMRPTAIHFTDMSRDCLLFRQMFLSKDLIERDGEMNDCVLEILP